MKSLEPRLEPWRGNYCNHHSPKDTPKMPNSLPRGYRTEKTVGLFAVISIFKVWKEIIKKLTKNKQKQKQNINLQRQLETKIKENYWSHITKF